MWPEDMDRVIRNGEANALGFVQGLVPPPGTLDWIML
jgi:hypothetical protein